MPGAEHSPGVAACSTAHTSSRGSHSCGSAPRLRRRHVLAWRRRAWHTGIAERRRSPAGARRVVVSRTRGPRTPGWPPRRCWRRARRARTPGWLRPRRCWRRARRARTPGWPRPRRCWPRACRPVTTSPATRAAPRRSRRPRRVTCSCARAPVRRAASRRRCRRRGSGSVASSFSASSGAARWVWCSPDTTRSWRAGSR